MRGMIQVAILSLSAQPVFAYMSASPGAAPAETMPIHGENGDPGVEGFYQQHPELGHEWKEIKERSENREAIKKELQEQEKARKAREAEAKTEKKSGTFTDAVPLGAFDQGRREAAPEGRDERDKERLLKGGLKAGSALGQLVRSAGRAPSEVEGVDGGQAVDPVDAGAVQESQLSLEERVRRNIHKIAQAKGMDERAKYLFEKGLNAVYFNEKKFTGRYGAAVMAATRAQIEAGDADAFPTMEFGDVPDGAAATWQGEENGGAGAHITMGFFLKHTSDGTLRIWDHEFMGHDRDSGKGDGTPIGENPRGPGPEGITYPTMGCYVGLGGEACGL